MCLGKPGTRDGSAEGDWRCLRDFRLFEREEVEPEFVALAEGHRTSLIEGGGCSRVLVSECWFVYGG